MVRASSENNRDLWKGLRGGSNKFGIVTRVELVVFGQGLLWSALTINSTTMVDQQAQIYGSLMKAENFDENASFLTGWAFTSAAGGSVVLNQLVYTKPNGTENPPFYQDVLNLTTIPGIGSTPIVANMSTLSQTSLALNPIQVSRYVDLSPHYPFH